MNALQALFLNKNFKLFQPNTLLRASPVSKIGEPEVKSCLHNILHFWLERTVGKL